MGWRRASAWASCIALFAAASLALVTTWGGCATCGPDDYEPNDDEGSASDAGEISQSLNEIGTNFDVEGDVDCFRYALPAPVTPETPIFYIEFKEGQPDDKTATLSFSCDGGGAPTFFNCNGEETAEPACEVSGGVQPRFRVAYDCDAADDAIGSASVVVCVTRADPVKLCVDYAIRAYLN